MKFQNFWRARQRRFLRRGERRCFFGFGFFRRSSVREAPWITRLEFLGDFRGSVFLRALACRIYFLAYEYRNEMNKYSIFIYSMRGMQP